MFSFKVMLISASVLSTAILLKFSVPAIADFAVYEVPSIYNRIVSWLRPPYLYLLINCIIITILASSKLQSRKEVLSRPPMQAMGSDAVHPQPVAPLSAKSIQTEYLAEDYTYDGGVPSDSSVYQVAVQKRLNFDDCERVEARGGTKKEEPPFVVRAAGGGAAFVEDAMSNKENEYVIGKSSRNEYLPAEYSPFNVKPPVSARFVHRRNVRRGPEGGKTVLGVSKPKRTNTLESPWKTNTNGRPMPLTRHLSKYDTSWEREHVVRRQEKTMAKAATFNNTDSGSGGKQRRESPLSQDELNRRVEAFIKKFNEDIKLQRGK